MYVVLLTNTFDVVSGSLLPFAQQRYSLHPDFLHRVESARFTSDEFAGQLKPEHVLLQQVDAVHQRFGHTTWLAKATTNKPSGHLKLLQVVEPDINIKSHSGSRSRVVRSAMLRY